MADSIYYKVSLVVVDGKYPGAIISTDKRPEIGDELSFNGRVYEVLDVMELMAAVGDFGFLHATCKYVRDIQDDDVELETE